MPRILLEDYQGTFVVDRSSIVQESVGNATFTRVPGRLSMLDEVNGNNRRYRRQVWEKNLAEGSHLRSMMDRFAAFGLLEHPESGEINLNSPIAVTLTEANLDGNEVVGAFRILNTTEGQKLKALIEGGYNPTVSSRGFGSLVRAADGVDEVQDDYVCEGWDVVFKPSFTKARLEIPVVAAATESVKKTPVGTTPSKVATLAEAAPVSAPTKTPTQETPVDIKNTKNVIESMKTMVPSKLTSKSFAAGMARLAEAHAEVATYAAEDTRRSWEATQLHESISTIEQTWSAAMEAPVKEASRLRESNKNLKSVLKATAETAVNYREKASKAVTEAKKLREMCAEITKRGRGWMARAKASSTANIEENEEYRVVCTAVKKLAEKHKSLTKQHSELTEAYNHDVTEVGRTLLQTEFAEKLALPENEELAQKLAEATKPETVIEVREALTGVKSPKSTTEAKKDKEEKEKPAKGKTLDRDRLKGLKKDDEKGEKGKPKFSKKEESQEADPKKAPAITESKDTVKTEVTPAGTPATIQIISPAQRDPRNFNEAIEVAQRLSSNQTKQLVG